MERTKKWTKKTDAHLETNQDLRSGPITARLWRTRERLKTFASVNRVTGIRNREKRQGIWEKWKANWDISTARIKTGEREGGRRLHTVLALPSRSLHLEAGPSQGSPNRWEPVRFDRLPVKLVRFRFGPVSNQSKFKIQIWIQKKWKIPKKFRKILQGATNLMVSNFLKNSFV